MKVMKGCLIGGGAYLPEASTVGDRGDGIAVREKSFRIDYPSSIVDK